MFFRVGNFLPFVQFLLAISVNKNMRCVRDQKMDFYTIYETELSMQVLSYFTSIEILSDLKLEKCGPHTAGHINLTYDQTRFSIE